MAMPEVNETETDFAIIVYREDDRWDADVLPVAVTDDLQGLSARCGSSRASPARSASPGSPMTSSSRSGWWRSQVSVLLSDIAAARGLIRWPSSGARLPGHPRAGRGGHRPGPPGGRPVDLRRPRPRRDGPRPRSPATWRSTPTKRWRPLPPGSGSARRWSGRSTSPSVADRVRRRSSPPMRLALAEARAAAGDRARSPSAR